jgi:hypothetical protein
MRFEQAYAHSFRIPASIFTLVLEQYSAIGYFFACGMILGHS